MYTIAAESKLDNKYKKTKLYNVEPVTPPYTDVAESKYWDNNLD